MFAESLPSNGYTHIIIIIIIISNGSNHGLTTQHALPAKVGTNFGDKQRSLGHGVLVLATTD
jgi:hypothetical protein